MNRLVPLVLLLASAAAFAYMAQPEGVQKGKVAKVDPDRPSVTVTVDGKDRELLVTADTKFAGIDGKTTAERLKNLKVGSEVDFKAETRDGKEVLWGVRAAQPQPRFDTSKLKPLTELGSEKYQGHAGGLYPDGKNERPAEHEKAGLALAKEVVPRDAAGKPDPAGKIVLLSVGMSNTSQESEAFARLLAKDAERNPKLVFVNGAQGSMTARAIQNPKDNATGTKYWATVDERLKAAGVTAAQVQGVWIKEADAGPTEGFPKYAETLSAELEAIVRLLPERFPNARLAYPSSRTYGGYATTPLNPEPYAYESGFSVRWLIERQLKGEPGLNYDPAKGPVKAPWLSWGPYLWANGTTKRADGLFYERTDFTDRDGTHPSAAGQEKVAGVMMKFFKEDSTTRGWFLK
ncbi:MAG TPA: hypothetical protein VKE74_22140 [Gemmataceae bacterium]|nr:hypothetical protein [Gemmataceae bacterium]